MERDLPPGVKGLCVDCFWQHTYADQLRCRNPEINKKVFNPVTGWQLQMLTCAHQREERGNCGPRGEFFKPDAGPKLL